jgi:uncharacterized protein YceH (UPF0502 family)
MQITPTEVRILGSLIEKESTTPDNYPLSLNALTAACNQTSNRDPIMDLGEDAVRWAINNLRQQSLVRAVQQAGSRVMKYQHLVAERMHLEGPSLGVMCVLMLRGAQTPGEIRGRVTRLAELASVDDVEAVLRDLVSKQLVVELARRPGQKEARFAHVLSGPVATEAFETEAATESPRRERAEDRIAALEATVAELRAELVDLRAQLEELRTTH